jgi:hypothetical protein
VRRLRLDAASGSARGARVDHRFGDAGLLTEDIAYDPVTRSTFSRASRAVGDRGEQGLLANTGWERFEGDVLRTEGAVPASIWTLELGGAAPRGRSRSPAGAR